MIRYGLPQQRFNDKPFVYKVLHPFESADQRTSWVYFPERRLIEIHFTGFLTSQPVVDIVGTTPEAWQSGSLRRS